METIYIKLHELEKWTLEQLEKAVRDEDLGKRPITVIVDWQSGFPVDLSETLRSSIAARLRNRAFAREVAANGFVGFESWGDLALYLELRHYIGVPHKDIASLS